MKNLLQYNKITYRAQKHFTYQKNGNKRENLKWIHWEIIKFILSTQLNTIFVE